MKLMIIAAAVMTAIILAACLPQSETGKQPTTQPVLPQEPQQTQEPSIQSIEQNINTQELDEIAKEANKLPID